MSVRELQAARRLLATQALGAKVREGDVSAAGIDFEAIRERCFSTGERLLCDAAWSLWNGGGEPVSLRDLCDRLDDESWGALIEALELRRHG